MKVLKSLKGVATVTKGGFAEGQLHLFCEERRYRQPAVSTAFTWSLFGHYSFQVFSFSLSFFSMALSLMKNENTRSVVALSEALSTREWANAGH